MIKVDNMEEIFNYAKDLKLLYVEDDPIVKQSTIELLEDMFSEIVVASDGDEGLEKFKQHPDIDIVITDIVMPKLDGLEMAKAIKNINPNIHILIFSAYDKNQFFLKSIQVGIDGYLLKPIDPQQLFMTLKNSIKKMSTFYIKKIDSLNDDLQIKAKQLEVSMKIISENVVMSKTNLSGVLTDVSDAFCKLSGYSKDELIGKSHNIVRHPDMPKSLFRDLWNTIKQNKTWRGEIKNKRKDGSYYWFIANISPDYDIYGKKIGYIAIRTDITAKKHYEEEHKKLIQTEKLASMGELIGNLAHQWRQPLSVISTAATGMLLQYEANRLDGNMIEEYCKTIDDKAQYLSNTLDSFRELLKTDKVKTLFSLKSELDDFLNILHKTIEEQHISMIINIQEDINIVGYENDLTKCYINLFQNSLDAFIKHNIKERLIFITTKVENDKLKIIFKDNGQGIDDALIEKIFDPYFTTKHQSQGTGMGLNIVYNIITHDMQGEITVSNTTYIYNETEYKGLKVEISLPL